MFIYFVVGLIGMTLVMYRYIIIKTSEHCICVAVRIIVSNFKQMCPWARLPCIPTTMDLALLKMMDRITPRMITGRTTLCMGKWIFLYVMRRDMGLAHIVLF